MDCLGCPPLSPPHDDTIGDSPALYAQWIVATVRQLLAAAQAERMAKLDAGLVAKVFEAGDRVQLRTKELLNSVDIGKLRTRLR